MRGRFNGPFIGRDFLRPPTALIRVRCGSQRPVIFALASRTRSYTCLSAFERYADEVALSPDKATVPSCAKFVERQFKLQRYRWQILRENAGAGVCDISDGARPYACLFAEAQQGVLDYFRSADRSSFIHRSRTQRTSCRSSGAHRSDAKLFQRRAGL